MLGVREMGTKRLVDEHLVGGTVYQAFLDPWCYHRWHSPVSGTIVRSYRLGGGTHYLFSPSFPFGDNNKFKTYISSLPLYSMVSTRQIYIIKMDDADDKYVAVIEIGMAEVSSCQSTTVEGQHINKGDELGFFQFGGSSYAMVFDKGLELTFNPEIYTPNEKGEVKKQLVNSWIATFE